MIKEYAIYRIYNEKSNRFMGKPWTKLSYVKLWVGPHYKQNPSEIPDDWIVYDLNSIHGLSTYPVKDIMK